MAFQEVGFIDWESFLTFTGQLRTFGRDAWGQLTASSVTTVPVIVYSEQDNQNNTVPMGTQALQHFACIPSSFTVVPDYHLTAVVDPNGNTVLADAKIKTVQDFNHHTCGARIKLLTLEITASPV